MRATASAGFTLVELLIVVVIIGILAMIAIPKFQDTVGKANKSAMMSDLRNLTTAEEGYMFENDTYTSVLSAMSYNASPGVTVNINTATASGWSASATNPASYPLTCAIFYGNVPPLSPAAIEGLINCQ
jgi:prepilin-type N-terminal cleavage/methylation domain-containing protein